MDKKTDLTAQEFATMPYAFECPVCNHFPIKKLTGSSVMYFCKGCERDFVSCLDVLGGLRFMQDLGKKGIKDYPARAFERIPGATRKRGPRVF